MWERHNEADTPMSAIDWQIRRYTNIRDTKTQMAEHFAEAAGEAQEMLDYWLGERNRHFGGAGLENVVALDTSAGPEVA